MYFLLTVWLGWQVVVGYKNPYVKYKSQVRQFWPAERARYGERAGSGKNQGSRTRPGKGAGLRQ